MDWFLYDIGLCRERVQTRRLWLYKATNWNLFHVNIIIICKYAITMLRSCYFVSFLRGF